MLFKDMELNVELIAVAQLGDDQYMTDYKEGFLIQEWAQ